MTDSALDSPSAQPQQSPRRLDLLALFRGAVRLVLESVLDQEVREMVGARRYERLGSRKDYLNGTYLRRLLTSLGEVTVDMPRTRHGGSPVEVIGRYERRTAEIDDMVASAYVHGVSTRDMAHVTRALMGEEVSRSTVSRVTKVLEQQVEGLRKAPIEKTFPYLYLDATFLDARWARTVENVSALVAYGVDEDGHRQLLAVTIGAQESEPSWTELLKQLDGRGLRGVRLVIADGHQGLAKAVRLVLPEAQLQRCTVHLERNVLAKTPKRLRGRVTRALRELFNTPTLPKAKERLHTFSQALGQQVPEALDCLQEGFAAATRFYEYPQAHWVRIRTTNGLERLHGEIKRRIRSVGAFPDRGSALRLVTTVALETTTLWGARRYLDMTFLAPVERKAA
jgi:putative transposase